MNVRIVVALVLSFLLAFTGFVFVGGFLYGVIGRFTGIHIYVSLLLSSALAITIYSIKDSQYKAALLSRIEILEDLYDGLAKKKK